MTCNPRDYDDDWSLGILAVDAIFKPIARKQVATPCLHYGSKEWNYFRKIQNWSQDFSKRFGVSSGANIFNASHPRVREQCTACMEDLVGF
jgi:hypothetical protein